VPPAPDGATDRIRFSQKTAKDLRERFDLTQQELAELLEVSTMTITSWETGKSRPRRSNLAQIVTLSEMDQPQVDQALARSEAPAQVSPDDLRETRDRLALTQADLAQILGVSIASVASWEAGKTIPSRASRAAIAELEGATSEDVERRLGRSMAGRMRRARQAKSLLTPEEVRAIRLKHGMSQREMAEALDVSINTISNWETSRSTPRGRSIEKLLDMR
jgi:DNA-binding transcriptional regulator YiaG